MKIKQSQLVKIIKEEIDKARKEAELGQQIPAEIQVLKLEAYPTQSPGSERETWVVALSWNGIEISSVSIG